MSSKLERATSVSAPFSKYGRVLVANSRDSALGVAASTFPNPISVVIFAVLRQEGENRPTTPRCLQVGVRRRN